MPSLHLPVKGRSVIIRALYAPICSLGCYPERSPGMQEETVSELLLHLDCHKPMGPDGLRPGLLRELVGVPARCQQVLSDAFSAQQNEKPEKPFSTLESSKAF